MNLKFSPLSQQVKDFISTEIEGLKNHLRDSTENAIDFFQPQNTSERLWEKNIPLWVAEYFIQRGHPSYKMNGNYHISGDMFSHESKKKKILEFLKISQKSQSKNHADFTLFTDNHKTPILIVEIKSQLNNKYEIWDGIFQDILVVAGHQTGLSGKGISISIFINKDINGNVIGESYVMEKILEQFRKREIDVSENDFNSFLKSHFICIF